jgi:hypothetical protein
MLLLSGALQLISNEAYVYTVGRHVFNDEQSVVISGCGAPYDGTRTVKSVNLDTFAVTSVGLVTQIFRDMTDNPYTLFTFDLTNADINFKQVIPSGKATLVDAATYVGNDAIESAIYVVSTEVFQSSHSSRWADRGRGLCAYSLPHGQKPYKPRNRTSSAIY